MRFAEEVALDVVSGHQVVVLKTEGEENVAIPVATLIELYRAAVSAMMPMLEARPDLAQKIARELYGSALDLVNGGIEAGILRRGDVADNPAQLGEAIAAALAATPLRLDLSELRGLLPLGSSTVVVEREANGGIKRTVSQIAYGQAKA